MNAKSCGHEFIKTRTTKEGKEKMILLSEKNERTLSWCIKHAIFKTFNIKL